MIKHVIIFLTYFSISYGRKIGCEGFNITDCESYRFYFTLENIKYTLHCLGYDKLEYPQIPTKILVKRQVNYLNKMEESEGQIHLEERYELQVYDPRLDLGFCENHNGSHRMTYEGQEMINQIFWIPDLDTFNNSTYKPTFNKAYIRFRSDKHFHNVRIRNGNYKTKIRCTMDFQWYPFDRHICSHPFLIEDSIENVDIDYDPEFTMIRSSIERTLSPDWYITLKVVNIKETEDGLLLPLDIIFERKLSSHILHVYTPSLMLSVASVTSLFIPAEYMPGRMSLSVTSCLSMITLFVGAK